MILALETATLACSAALVADDGALVAESVSTEGPAHTQRLLPAVHEVLLAAGVDFAAVTTVAVGLGPGTFTGMRIGIATARALARAGDELRLVGVPTLAALGWALAADSSGRHAAAGSPDGSPQVVALIDGRRKEVFAGCYALSDGALVAVGQSPTVVRAADLAAFLEPFAGALVGGDGAHLYAGELPDAVRLAALVTAPTARMIAAAWLAGVPGCVEGLGAVLPIYGRAPDAARWTAKAPA